jgi:hypothetical protein
MQPFPSAAVLAASLSLLAVSVAAEAPAEALARARDLLGRNDASKAAELLEEALPGTSSADRPAVLDLLRRAYESAARQAEAAGRTREAEAYRDNLEILNRKPRVKATAPADASIRRASVELGNGPASPPEPTKSPPPAVETPAVAPQPAPVPIQADARPATTHTSADDVRARVKAADEAFKARRYDEAGQIYAALEGEHNLPRSRRGHWAYCRSKQVVDRINAKPKTPREWQEIDAEIARIQELSPTYWFGEYLRNYVAERAPGRRQVRSNKLVVRGSSPEEAPPGLLAADDPARDTGPLLDVGRRVTPIALAGEPRAEPERKPARVGNWLVMESANFRILYADHDLAEQVARAAEAAREAQTKRWTGSAPRGPWSPRCDIYLYPTARIFSQMTGQPEESPGFSTMGMNGGRIIARRINLRADHPNLVPAILPHEVTHVVLADLFPHKQIPRWADEGMAVLSEPGSEQRLRAADLEEPLSSGKLFKVQDLMVMDYPDGQFWGLYYAQSVSLTRFLVEQGTPTQFVEFVQGCQRNGHEAELRRVYKIEGMDELHQRWVSYARTQSAAATAAAKEAGSTRR